LSGVLTSVWYLLGDPYGIDNMYIAVITPFIVMVIDRYIGGNKKQNISENSEFKGAKV
jgi:SSS family solute:Na+ symporter